MGDWETVKKGNGYPHETLYRVLVEGGWLYKEHGTGLCFVPVIDSLPSVEPEPVPLSPVYGHPWDESPTRPTNPAEGTIDADFTEVPVNGSKVTTLTEND